MEILCWLCMLIAAARYKYKWIFFIIAFDVGMNIKCIFPRLFMRFSTRHSRHVDSAEHEFSYKYRDHVKIQTRFYVLERTFVLWKYWHTISFLCLYLHRIPFQKAPCVPHYFYRKKRAKNADSIPMQK